MQNALRTVEELLLIGTVKACSLARLLDLPCLGDEQRLGTSCLCVLACRAPLRAKGIAQGRMSALFDFSSFCVVSLLGICACTYVRQQFPTLVSNKHGCALPLAVHHLTALRVRFEACAQHTAFESPSNCCHLQVPGLAVQGQCNRHKAQSCGGTGMCRHGCADLILLTPGSGRLHAPGAWFSMFCSNPHACMRHNTPQTTAAKQISSLCQRLLCIDRRAMIDQ